MRIRIGVCSDCQQRFEHHKAKGFLPKRCPSCQRKFGNDRQKRWREANPEKWKAARDRDWAKRAPDPDYLRKKRERETRRLYGMSPEEFDEMLASQSGVCAICGKLPQGRANGRARVVREARLHVDHCHAAGHVRGLLCGNCNTLIGLAGEDPAVLLAAVEYLTKG